LQPGFATTGFTFTSTRDVVRALLLLQDDVERMLPLVNALNGGSPTNLAVFFSTNNSRVATNALTTFPTGRTPALTPTGR
jgi:hypothetical protein